MEAPQNHTSTTRSQDPRETYTLGGLLVYGAVVPAFATLLAVPGLVTAFAFGALTAILLNRALGLI